MTKTIHIPAIGRNTTFTPRLAPPPIAEPPVTQPEPEPAETLLLQRDLSEPEQYIYRRMIFAPQQHRPELRIRATLQQVARFRAKYVADWMNAWQPGEELPGHNDRRGRGPNWHVEAAGYALPSWYPQDEGANTIESLAYGHTGADAAWGMWMQSPLHIAHLLGHVRDDPQTRHPVHSHQTRCGIGHSFLGNGRSVFVVLTAHREGDEQHG